MSAVFIDICRLGILSGAALCRDLHFKSQVVKLAIDTMDQIIPSTMPLMSITSEHSFVSSTHTCTQVSARDLFEPLPEVHQFHSCIHRQS